MGIRFGPAGLGPADSAEDVLEELHKKGLKACEIVFAYSVYLKPEEALRIGNKAKELDIELSIHGSFFVNLNADDKAKLGASKKRILEACKIGELLGAKCVVFHPGFYGKDREGAYDNIKKAMLELMEIRKNNGWKIELAPETMGKINVFGSVEEISKLVKETGCGFCIDFAHVLAREKKIDYEKIKKAFPREDWHCHFSGIIYGDKGERKHKLTEKGEWKELLGAIGGLDKKIRIVNESPSPMEDAVDGMKLWKKIR
ncbi:MAG: TIM barrel protein [archaeon]